MSLCFFGRGCISRERVKFFKILRGVAHKRGCSDRFRFFLGGWGQVKRGEVNVSGWGDTLEETMLVLFQQQLQTDLSPLRVLVFQVFSYSLLMIPIRSSGAPYAFRIFITVKPLQTTTSLRRPMLSSPKQIPIQSLLYKTTTCLT